MGCSKADREQIIERIKKLMAHSVENGATEAEAVAFALKAQKLIADNDVEDFELGEECKREVIEVTTEKPYARTWRGILAVAVADNFRCKAIQCHKYAGTGSNRKVFITFIGYECDAKAASLVFEHLYSVGNKLAKAHENRCYTDTYAYDNFVRGFVIGVKDELEKQCQSLMLVCPQEVKEYFGSKNLGKARRMRDIYGNEHSQEAGRQAGSDAVRSRRVEGGKSDYLLDTA